MCYLNKTKLILYVIMIMLYWLSDYMYEWMSADSACWLEGLRVKCMRFQPSERYECARARQSRQIEGWGIIQVPLKLLSDCEFKCTDALWTHFTKFWFLGLWGQGQNIKYRCSKSTFPVHFVSQVVQTRSLILCVVNWRVAPTGALNQWVEQQTAA